MSQPSLRTHLSLEAAAKVFSGFGLRSVKKANAGRGIRQERKGRQAGRGSCRIQFFLRKEVEKHGAERLP
jgi:hypothetical protein